MRSAVLVALFATLLGWTGCSRSVETAPPAAAARQTPETMFATLEQRLGQTRWRMRFALEAEGAVMASLAGSLSMSATPSEEVELEVAGHFDGTDYDLRLWTEGDRLRAGPRDAPTLDVPRPPALAPALVIGLMRMGLLHNVAMLIAGAAPDHADGGVQAWVQTSDHQRIEADGEHGIGFDIVVTGQRAGRATLWLDPQGLPTRREQTVDFPSGQMRVVERYFSFEPEPPAGG